MTDAMITLDAAALDLAADPAHAMACRVHLVAQSRAAIDLRNRIATLEAELAEAQQAHADCAMYERGAVVRIGHLEAALMESSVKRFAAESRANALRDALEKMCAQFFAGDDSICHAGICHRDRCHRCSAIDAGNKALAQTPAASLAERDAEVLERAAKHHDECAIECRNDADRETFAESVRDFISQAQVHERSAAHFRALAAQEVKP